MSLDNEDRHLPDKAQNRIDRLLEIYEENPIVQALIQLAVAPVPYGIASALEAALSAKIEEIRSNRLRTFFDELANGEVPLTEELVQSEDFLHAYFSTLKASVNERNSHKIRLFAKLLLGGISKGSIGSDQFEEYLHALEDMTLRHVCVLWRLHRFEELYPVTPQVTGTRFEEYWDDFTRDATSSCGLPQNELKFILLQLVGFGFYEKYDRSIQGKLTPSVKEFFDWITSSNKDLPPFGQLDDFPAH